MSIDANSLSTMKQFVGQELGVSEWLTVDQQRINEFADCTGDHQWIHVDVERAKRESPFGTTIAHGYLTLSLLPSLQQSAGFKLTGVKAGLNYGLDRVRFIAPVPVGARIRDRVTLTSVEDKGGGRVLLTTRHTVEIEGEEKPAMIADSLAMLMG